jgi:hypothetical protein
MPPKRTCRRREKKRQQRHDELTRSKPDEMAAEFPQQLGLGIEHVRHAASGIPSRRPGAEHLLDELKHRNMQPSSFGFVVRSQFSIKEGLQGGCRKSRV